ncbi:sodium:dicarboxylate symporter [Sphingomonas sp. Leaf412]|uniref:dicarboxylate/amino acid:cation symporter n=1 Tax=Sphingomonas sp. Leaf412 TaxID=1736370 RepID=UPI0006FA53C6|nr:cation:dicarboxylase symporter family transporter [Sphingomonas sp. Leaf412]KQT33343.1 sodium:dicarboxylate symporter [Sphingomonas sp. Leaf412]
MSQATRILIALVAGLLAGIALAAWAPGAVDPVASVASPIGTAWLNALQMTIVPLVVSLLITGIAATAEAAQAGKLAGRSIALYTAMMATSAVVASLLTPLFLDLAPIPAASAASLRAALTDVGPVPTPPRLGDFIAATVPSNVVKAAAESSFLSLIVFTLVFAFALMRAAPAARDLLVRFFTAVRDVMLIVIGWVLWIAPVGVGALALVVGARAGSGAFGALIHYILTVSAVGAVITVAAYPIAILGGRVPASRFARAIVPSQAVAVSTQSSLGSLPAMLEGARDMGVPVATAGVTLPIAVAILRATGPAMNLAVAIYVATWFGIAIPPAVMAVAVVVATLTSLGSVSLPGTVSFISAISPIAATLGAPVAPLGLLVAVETLPDIMRTLGNVTMDLATTMVLARWQGDEEIGDEDTATG